MALKYGQAQIYFCAKRGMIIDNNSQNLKSGLFSNSATLIHD